MADQNQAVTADTPIMGAPERRWTREADSSEHYAQQLVDDGAMQQKARKRIQRLRLMVQAVAAVRAASIVFEDAKARAAAGVSVVTDEERAAVQLADRLVQEVILAAEDVA